MKKLFELLDEYEQKNDSGLISVRIYSDGSGVVYGDIDEELFEFDKIDEFYEKIKAKKGLRWEDLEKVEGWYVDTYSEVRDSCVYHYEENIDDHKNIFPTEQDAKSSLALAQLLQVRKKMIGDWDADWNKKDQIKWCIVRDSTEIVVITMWTAYENLSFPTEEMAQDFLEANRDLVETYWKL